MYIIVYCITLYMLYWSNQRICLFSGSPKGRHTIILSSSNCSTTKGRIHLDLSVSLFRLEKKVFFLSGWWGYMFVFPKVDFFFNGALPKCIIYMELKST